MALGAWAARGGPLYSRLADAIGDAIAQGLLGAGTRLPAERLLAQHLGVSRGTVVGAYAALRARGAAATRRGSGTVVRTGGPGSMIHRAALLSRLVDAGHVPIDLSIGAAQIDGELPDVGATLSGAATLLPAHGYAPLGAAALREAIARHMTVRGTPTGADQVIVTAGGQGALSLIAAAFIRAGDRVLVEAPTYPGAIEAFARAGADVQGIERDHAGPRRDGLERALRDPAVRLLYLVPTCHNPTGGVMTEGRRREVLRLAAARGVPVVEDAVLQELLLDGTPPPALSALDPANVLTVGSLSKSVWGGLRVGWVRAPAGSVLRMGRVKAAIDLGSPALEQAAALEILRRFDVIVAARRRLLRERLGMLAGEVALRLPDWSFPAPLGGWSLWARLPRGSGDDLVQLALRRGVAIASGSCAAPDDRFIGYVRLCAGPEPEVIREGVRLLAEAWRQLGSLPAAAPAEPALIV